MQLDRHGASLIDLTGDYLVTYYRSVDEVFRALADPTRRQLLDALFEEDGQTLSALEARLPMTRFGVMKHLRVLEQANLLTTRRRGREKLHFLNPVPIRLVHDRWVSKYAEPWAAGLSDLKQAIEKEDSMEKVFEIYIRTTPERLWEAITDGSTMRVMLPPGYEGELPEASGEQIEVDPPRRLVQRMVAEWSEEVKREGPSRITWEIEPVGTSCRLRVTHDELREGANDELYGGWTMILSGLKTLLETGGHLDTPASLRFAAADDQAA
jgi:DNA-binding transcriptional ArsR family regulator